MFFFHSKIFTMFSIFLRFTMFSIFLRFLFYIGLRDLSFLSVSVKIFLSCSLDYSVYVFIDYKSLIFVTTVRLIAFNVFFFSSYYIENTLKSSIFLFLTLFFILSIIIFILVSDFFIIMLGWDGLGVFSFFLILFYESSKSIFSGLFTIIVNRLGDCFFILSIVFLFVLTPSSIPTVLWSNLTFGLSVLIMLGAITKSAIFPFSSWLPAAIAAPTPISALVHSSTLVTAGLFVIMRFFDVIPFEIKRALLCLGLFTSFYAGLSSLFETDLKKVVALSTLSHLGFICSAIFRGSLILSFLHLVSHALFKSLLFLAVGEVIHVLSHRQDKRILRTVGVVSGHASWIVLVSVFGLIGFPFVRGFYSKDMILEIFSYSILRLFIIVVVLLNVCFTFFYSLVFVQSIISFSNFSSFTQISSRYASLYISVILILFSLFSVTTVNLIILYSPVYFLFVLPSLQKLMPFLILLVFILIFVVRGPLNLNNNSLGLFFSSIIFLTPFLRNITSKFTVIIMMSYVKCYELGLINYFSNRFYLDLLSKVSMTLYVFLNYYRFVMVLFLSSVVCLFVIF